MFRLVLLVYIKPRVLKLGTIEELFSLQASCQWLMLIIFVPPVPEYKGMHPCLLIPWLSLFSEVKQISSERRALQRHSGAARDDSSYLNTTHQPLVGPG